LARISAGRRAMPYRGAARGRAAGPLRQHGAASLGMLSERARNTGAQASGVGLRTHPDARRSVRPRLRRSARACLERVARGAVLAEAAASEPARLPSTRHQPARRG
jgi:hypothetical protein